MPLASSGRPAVIFRLSNTMETSLPVTISSIRNIAWGISSRSRWSTYWKVQPHRAFGQAKWDTLPQFCRNCEVLNMCHGGCPKDRILRTPDGQEGLNYTCARAIKPSSPTPNLLSLSYPAYGAGNPWHGPIPRPKARPYRPPPKSAATIPVPAAAV